MTQTPHMGKPYVHTRKNIRFLNALNNIHDISHRSNLVGLD